MSLISSRFRRQLMIAFDSLVCFSSCRAMATSASSTVNLLERCENPRELFSLGWQATRLKFRPLSLFGVTLAFSEMRASTGWTSQSGCVVPTSLRLDLLTCLDRLSTACLMEKTGWI